MRRVAVLGVATCLGLSAPHRAALPARAFPSLGPRPELWATGDGHRVNPHDGHRPEMAGNALWHPDGAIELFGLRDETLAFQVVATAGDLPLEAVTAELTLPSLPEADLRPSVVCTLTLHRRSGGTAPPEESLGWEAGHAPAAMTPPGFIADPLVPLPLAPTWCDYPLTVAPHRHRALWFEVHLPRDATPGRHAGSMQIRGDMHRDVPVVIDVGAPRLPYRAAATMVYFDPEEVRLAMGEEAVNDLHQRLHAHHLSAVFPLRSVEDVRRHADALTGRQFTRQEGYAGPGLGVGADVVLLGAYGSLGEPAAAKLARLQAMLDELARLGIEDRPGEVDILLYAVDEQCDSPRAPRWRSLLDAADDPRLRALRVTHSCSHEPATQPVDVALVHAPHYEPGEARQAQAVGKRVWIYNGVRPATGCFLTDCPLVDLRANAWIQWRDGIDRWFYWESTFWLDGNRGGRGPYDVWRTAETFHNQHGDHANGDGVLLYPGRQPPPFRSLGVDQVIPSMRLAAWRRGVQDAAYLQLAEAVAPDQVHALVAKMVSPPGAAPFVQRPDAWTRARRALYDLITMAAPSPR